MQLDNRETFAAADSLNSDYARSKSKDYACISSNIRFLFHQDQGLSWARFGNGAGLASLALALAPRRVYIASSHRYNELFPWGSHLLTDPLFSTESTEFIHDGAEASRSEKIKRIAEDQEGLKLLRVCWRDDGYNCGTCEKCLRTRTTLRALGLSTPTLAPLESVKPVHQMRLHTEADVSFAVDNLQAAEAGDDRELAEALRKCLRRYRYRKLGRDVDDVFLGGKIRAWRSKRNPR